MTHPSDLEVSTAAVDRIYRISSDSHAVEGFGTIELARSSRNLVRSLRVETFESRGPGELLEGYLPRHVVTISHSSQVEASVVWTDGPRVGPETWERAEQPGPIVGIFPAFWPYRASWSGALRRGLFVELAPEVLDAAGRGGGRDPVELLPGIHRNPLLFHLGHALNALLDQGESAFTLEAESLGMAIAAHLVQSYRSEGPAVRRRSTVLPPRTLRELDALIEERLHTPLALSELASVARMSVFYFARSFKHSTGLSPHAYVLRRRIERGRMLLENGHLTIGEVAFRCGFAQQSHFAETFRRLTGKSPREYRGAVDRTRS